MTDPVAAATPSVTPRWGVWDHHLREWVVPPTLADGRAAWHALIDTSSLHPWELEAREDTPEPNPRAANIVVCPECHGDTECYACGRECLRCDGAGEVHRAELAPHELKRTERREAAT